MLTDQDVWDDGYISNNQGANPLDAGGFFLLTFSGLDDTLEYDLEGGFDSNNANFDATWASGGQSFLTTPTGAAGTGYGTLSGLTTDGAGNLAITVTRETLHVTIGGLTLTAVESTAIPEPSSALALLGLCGVAFIKRRRG